MSDIWIYLSLIPLFMYWLSLPDSPIHPCLPGSVPVVLDPTSAALYQKRGCNVSHLRLQNPKKNPRMTQDDAEHVARLKSTNHDTIWVIYFGANDLRASGVLESPHSFSLPSDGMRAAGSGPEFQGWSGVKAVQGSTARHLTGRWGQICGGFWLILLHSLYTCDACAYLTPAPQQNGADWSKRGSCGGNKSFSENNCALSWMWSLTLFNNIQLQSKMLQNGDGAIN